MSDLHILAEIRAGLADEEAVDDLVEPHALPATPSTPLELAELVAKRLRLTAEAREESKPPRRAVRRIERSAGEEEGPAVEVETSILSVPGNPRFLAELRLAFGPGWARPARPVTFLLT